MSGAATTAIVSTRLRRESWFIAFSMFAFALAAFLQRYEDGAAQLAGCLIFGTLIAVRIAILQRRAGRLRELVLHEQCAPLYGRELARATALVPCVVVTLGICAYWIVESFFAPASPFAIALTLASGNASTLVALSATLRLGIARFLYIAIACLVAIVAYASAGSLPLLGLAVCIICGFVALRQYGEALARYDPIP